MTEAAPAASPVTVTVTTAASSTATSTTTAPPLPPTTTTTTGKSSRHASATKFDLEPNPFEQSFASKESTPNSAGKLVGPGQTTAAAAAAAAALLPPVASIASPSSLLGSGGPSSANYWGINSLRSGPLSPAMLQGPQSSTPSSSSLAGNGTTSSVGGGVLSFVDAHHLRTGLTPNESGIRTGLTPGGSGSIFPAPSPTTAALFGLVPPTPNGLQTGPFPPTPTPVESASSNTNTTTTATTAPAASSSSSQATSVTVGPTNPLNSITSSGQDQTQAIFHILSQNRPLQHLPTTSKQEYDPASAAASGLFMLSQGQQQQQLLQQQQQHNNASVVKEELVKDTKRKPNKKQARKSDETATGPNKRQRGNASRNAMPSHLSDTDDAGAGGIDDDDEDEDDNDDRRGSADSTGSTNITINPAMTSVTTATAGSINKKMTDEEKRKNFLERNRVAALKCRQRKKQWLSNLQAKVEYYGTENDALNAQVTALREQVVNLKALLLAHKDCSATRALPPGQDPINLALSQDFVLHSSASATSAGAATTTVPMSSLTQSLASQISGSRRYV
ncbi:hypothetical protein V1514DRAFT_334135 [Lipomyces japonicus]|uniref:uncharacterized protein n=1 Tax=Lipomyces japonicus TaxID=56871 RepID=UPI0034CE0C67